MRLPKYPSYKESGIGWVGCIPSHWTVMQLGQASTERCDGPFGSGLTSDHYTDEGALVVRLQNIKAEGFYAGEPAYIDVSYFRNELTRHAVIPDDLLIAGLGDDRNLVGRACVAPAGLGEALVKADCFRFRLDQSLALPAFAALQLTAGAAFDAGSLAGGTTRSRIPLGAMASRKIALPPMNEQCAIASFLESETAKIDALIAEQEKLIALLAEKRQATISHAVTKGLDPSAPMKDSGVAWLGKVPAHWVITRLKFIAKVQTGIAKGKDTAGKETIDVPYLRVANVQDGFLALDDVATLAIEPEQLMRYRLLPGDVLMNEGGDFDKLGRGAVWHGEIPDCVHQNHVFAVRPHGVSAEWLNQITSSHHAQFYFMCRSKQSTNLASISSTNIMDLPVLLPPVDEQYEILAFIAEETGRLDALRAASDKAIALLRERRSALIAAAVTGQIDVRNA
ncbi:restriction endonuclease subunit S [Rubrivivax sp. JA1055]|uniref:restriction endonuclease subunit S n=2 Tax=unclassified Rubrivivax TaxID=2649762 RepID=UPI001E37862C|nr:restriction endonuclease subunit S [Rubrivivax sp. JA1029]MCC9598660.1 restriction endonuclease subunit S [Rubrivivax sp. JA1055]MCC9648360.1 restriction endonuclease subunit S [Rubrivivax sp. JA1029]